MVPALGCDQICIQDTRGGRSTTSKMLPVARKYQCRPWKTHHDIAPSAPERQLIDRIPDNVDQRKGFLESWGGSCAPKWKLPIAEGREHSLPDHDGQSLDEDSASQTRPSGAYMTFIRME